MKKFFSIALVIAMCMSLFPTTMMAAIDYNAGSDDYYKVVSKKNWDLAPGIVESEIILDNEAGNRRQVMHVVEVDPYNPYTKVIPSYKGMVPTPGAYGTQTMDLQAAYAEENGYGNVVAAMNISLSWYDGAYYASHPELVGEPLGYLILDGVQYTNSQGKTAGAQTCLVINFDEKDGEPRPANIPKTQIRSTADAITGWEEQVIPANFGFLVKDGKRVNSTESHTGDSAPRSMLGIKEDGTIVMVMNDGRQAPYSTGFNSYEMSDAMLKLGCVYAINGDGGGSSQFLSQRPGEELTVNCAPSDGALRSTTHGVLVITTAPATGEFVRATISADNTYYTPGSAVEFTAVGTDLVGTVADIPEDATWQLADDSFGTIDEHGIFASNGKVGDVTVQMVYNGEVVGETTISIVLPDIAFRNDTIVLGYGDSMMLPIDVTTNEGRNTVSYMSDDIVYTLSDDNLGTIVDGEFIACDESTGLTNGTITAVVCGQTDKAVTANIRFGKASEIVHDFEEGEILVDTDPLVAPAEGESYGWFIQDTRWLGHNQYRFYGKKNYTPIGYDIPTALYVVDETTGKVRNGDYAMAVDIDWTNVTASCHGQMDLIFPEAIDLTDATSVGLWVYLPDEMVTASMHVGAGFKSGRVDIKLTDFMKAENGIDNGGWYYFSWEVKDSYQELRYIEFNSHYTAVQGVDYNYYQHIKYYIDDITVDYSDATIDRELPYFTDMKIGNEYADGVKVNGQTINTNTINLMAEVKDNTTKVNATGINRDSVKLYVDGVLSDAEISVAPNGTVNVADLYLNDGVHTFLMEVEDNQGNVGNIVRKLVVNTTQSTVRLEAPATGELLPTDSIYWVNLVADDLEAIDSVTTTVKLDYVNTWELQGMEVAYGFDAQYYVDDQNNAVLTFTRTGTEIADTNILAKLPIRIWTAKGWLDDSGIRADYISNDPAKQDKYHILTPHAMWYSDGTRDYRLTVSAEAGVATFTDGSTETFSSNKNVLQTEMNRYYAVSDKQGKWSFHIHTPGEAQSMDATCTTAGYTDRVFCVGCACGTVENLGTECDTHNGCGSVIDWGTVVPALGHVYEVVDGKLTCVNGGEIFNGVYTDGKLYVDGVVVADGWNEDNTEYYLDGVKLTGAQFIDGMMYTFDENGTYLPDAKYNGIYEINGTIMYFINNEYLIGAQTIANDAYYFDAQGLGYDGEYVICGENCLFDNGRYASCSTADLMDAGWCGKNAEYVVTADGTLILGGTGATYEYKNHGNRPFIDHLNQIKKIQVGKGITVLNLNIFSYLLATEVVFEEGSKLFNISTGAFHSMPYLKNLNIPESVTIIGAIAFKNATGFRRINVPASVTGISDTAFKGTNAALTLYVAAGSAAEKFAVAHGIKYTNDSYIRNGFVKEDGEIYYYENDVKYTTRGMFKVDGDYYYAKSGGALVTDTSIWTTITNDLLPFGLYTFDENGVIQLKKGFIEENGEIYYYVDGAKYTKRGFFEVGEYIYYAKSDGALVRNTTIWTTVTNDILPFAAYTFDNAGRVQIKNGFVEENGEIYYYVKGVKWTQRGMFKVDGEVYYAKADGALVRNTTIWATVTNDVLPFAIYTFDNAGRIQLKRGFVEENGEIYYYVDGVKWTQRGMFKVDGNVYYAKADGALVRNTTIWATVTNDVLPFAKYTFDATGKIVR